MTQPHTPPYPVPRHSSVRLPARAAAPPRDGRRWTVQVGQRMRRLLWLKAIGISLFMWVFFIAYFHLLRNPAHPIIEMPLTALDRAITFQPAALVPYVSLWLYVGIAPGLLLSFRQLFVYGLWSAALCLTGLAFFYFAPTAVPPLINGPDLANYPAFAMLQGVDAAGNACPSLHVATAMFAAVWVDHLLRGVGAPRLLRAVSAIWFMLIVYSTLAIKQHVVLDVLAGVLLGLVFAWGSLRWRPADPRT